MRGLLVCALAAAFTLAGGPAAAQKSNLKALVGQTVVGAALALDGDTIRFAPIDDVEAAKDLPDAALAALPRFRVELWGIDACELRDWPCGPHARAALDDLIVGLVTCEFVGFSPPRGRQPARLVGKCSAGVRPADRKAFDLGREMVQAGWAVGDRRFSEGEFYGAELLARTGRRGVWRTYQD